MMTKQLNRMKRVKLLICFLLGGAGCFIAAAQAEPLVLGAGEWPPYISQNFEGEGMLSEIVAAAFEESGVAVKLAFYPWGRVLGMLDLGVHAAFGYIKTAERQEKWHYSDEITKGMTVFAVRRGLNFTWQGRGEDLKPYRIGVTHGYSYGDEFERIQSELRVQKAYTDEENFEKLLAGTIDLFCVDAAVGPMILRNRFSEEARGGIELILDPPLSEYSMYLVCAKTMPSCEAIIADFNQGLEKITQSGHKQRIIQRYTAFK